MASCDTNREKDRAYACIEVIATSCIVHARHVYATQHQHRIYRLPLILFRLQLHRPPKKLDSVPDAVELRSQFIRKTCALRELS